MNTNNEKCPVQTLIESIGGKWKVLILDHIQQQGVVRFNLLQHLVPGISQKVLAEQLKCLEADGLVIREVYPEVPPRVEYSLSDKGKGLHQMLDQFADWAGSNIDSDDRAEVDHPK